MAETFALDSLVVWTFPGSGNEYVCAVTEIGTIDKKGDLQTYRVKSNRMDCYAYHHDLRIKE